MQTRGPIIGGRFGPFLTAVLMDAEMIDEYFLKQGTKASGRLTVLNDEIGNALMYALSPSSLLCDPRPLLS
jgi:hypothetical protein